MMRAINIFSRYRMNEFCDEGHTKVVYGLDLFPLRFEAFPKTLMDL